MVLDENDVLIFTYGLSVFVVCAGALILNAFASTRK